MSGIVGSRLNIRGSGLVGSLGSDGQIFTSSGAGSSAVFEAAAGGGGKVLQVVAGTDATTRSTSSSSYVTMTLEAAITPGASSSKILCVVTGVMGGNSDGSDDNFNYDIQRSDNGGTFATTGGSGGHGKNNTNQSSNYNGGAGMSILDSPSSTNEQTYKVFAKTSAGDGTARFGEGNVTSHMTLLEIDGS